MLLARPSDLIGAVGQPPILMGPHGPPLWGRACRRASARPAATGPLRQVRLRWAILGFQPGPGYRPEDPGRLARLSHGAAGVFACALDEAYVVVVLPLPAARLWPYPLGPAAIREAAVLSERAENALRLDEALLAPATNLTTEYGGITAAVMQDAGGDREMARKISFSYRAGSRCSFGFELSPL